MQYSFTGVSRLVCEPLGDDNRTNLRSVEIALEMSKGLDHTMYQAKDGELLPEGIRALASCYIHGLAACVKLGQESGTLTLAMAKEIIDSELERAVKAPTEYYSRTYKP